MKLANMPSCLGGGVPIAIGRDKAYAMIRHMPNYSLEVQVLPLQLLFVKPQT